MSNVCFNHDPKWGPRKGLEGPFHYPSGFVLYYDSKMGQYYDPTTDMYVPNDEVIKHQIKFQ